MSHVSTHLFLGPIAENFVDYIPNLSSESACINECRNVIGCNFYTFYLEDDPNSGTCILLSSIIEPLEACPTCVTGALECENFDDCGFFYNGKKETHMIFSDPGVGVELSTGSISTCQLRVMAVGGGGHGSNGGGGSGYIQYFTQTLTSNPTLIKLAAGHEREASNVTIDGNTVRTLPGKNGGNDGGDGYSGGGDNYRTVGGVPQPCDGGTNGGDGECSGGGNGTGEDISTYLFDNFKLRPGSGGLHSNVGQYDYRGGGGGGILINDEGPGVRVNKNSGSNGEGFGGGGTLANGEPGVVIIEIVGV